MYTHIYTGHYFFVMCYHYYYYYKFVLTKIVNGDSFYTMAQLGLKSWGLIIFRTTSIFLYMQVKKISLTNTISSIKMYKLPMYNLLCHITTHTHFIQYLRLINMIL